MMRHHKNRRAAAMETERASRSEYAEAYRQAFKHTAPEARETTWRWELFGVDEMDLRMLSHPKTRYTGELDWT